MLLTFIVFAAALLWLILTHLSFNLDEAVEWPPKPDGELLLADEYIEVEMIPPVEEGGGTVDDDGASAPPAVAVDQVDQGAPAPAPSQIVTSTQPSPVTAPPVTETPKPPGPLKEEIEAQKAREKAQKDATEKIHSQVTFGKTPGATGTGDGLSGSGAGDSNQPSNHVGSGSGNAGGRGIRVNGSIVSSKPGVVYVDIRVDPSGNVVYAAINPGKSNLADPAVREKCLAAARSAKAGKSDKSTEDSGYIRFIFK